MITKEEFVKILTNYQKFREGVDNLFKAVTGTNGYYDSDWVEAANLMLETTIYSHFTDLGVDWVFYYLYENIDDKKVTVTLEANMFEEKRTIEYHLNSIEELWNFLITDKKTYFKNAD